MERGHVNAGPAASAVSSAATLAVTQVKTVQDLVLIHSLSWLGASNAIGCWLALLLSYPRLGALTEPFSYGRWMPLHLNFALYGWSSLPLVGLLLRLYAPHGAGERSARLAVGLWSGSLLWGAVSWLAGEASGKLFLDWKGPARWAFTLSLSWLGLVLLGSWTQEVKSWRSRQLSPQQFRILWGKGLLLVALLAVPWLWFWSAGPQVYPPINPDSGGATGFSLVASTLVVVLILGLCPSFLRLTAHEPQVTWRRARALLCGLLVHALALSLINHRDPSHHELPQILAICSLALWPPLLARYWRGFAWPKSSRPWRLGLVFWGSLLVFTGVVDFLPGMLERLKFTHALVAHAHIAMAGMVTCLGMVLLQGFSTCPSYRELLAARTPFWWWQSGSVVLVLALLGLGALEAAAPGALFASGSSTGMLVSLLLGLRLLGGVLMTTASFCWLRAAWAVFAATGDVKCTV